METVQVNEKLEKSSDVCKVVRTEKKPGPFRADSAIHWDTVLTERLSPAGLCSWVCRQGPSQVSEAGCSLWFHSLPQRQGQLSFLPWLRAHAEEALAAGLVLTRGTRAVSFSTGIWRTGECSGPGGTFTSWDHLPSGAPGNQCSIYVPSEATGAGRLCGITRPLLVVSGPG